MRANTDRAAGVRLVTDSPHTPLEIGPGYDTSVAHLDFETDIPTLDIVALKGRVTAGLGVQLLAEPIQGGRTFITLVLDGETETFEVPNDKALDAFEHPFTYGGSLL